MLSFRAGTHWQLSEEEATQLSQAVAAVARHYPVAKTQKAADWSQLLLIVLVLGVPRAVESYQQANNGQPRVPPPGPAAQPAAAPRTPAAPAPLPQTPGELDPGAMLAAMTVQ